MSIQHYLFLGVFAAVVTLVTTPIVRALARKYNIVARPGGRKIHREPIPELGGTALFVGISATIFIQYLGEQLWGWRGFLTDNTANIWVLLGVGAGAFIIYLTGLIDDIYDISPGLKLTGQIIAAAVVAASGLTIGFVSNPFSEGIIMLGILAWPITIIYLVAFANIINLVDGLDGLAAGVSGIAATSLVVIAAAQNQLAAAIIATALIGSVIGFLRYNFNPASIFMGDEGALLLGFLLGAISLMGVVKTTAAIALAVPLIIVGLPIFDTFSAIVRRVRHNRPIKEADKGHIHHRLLGRGFNQKQTVLMVYAWSGLLAVGGYAIRYAPSTIRTIALVGLLVVTAALAYWLGLFESAHYGERPRSD